MSYLNITIMKTSILTTSIACFGFAILPIQADEGTATKPVSTTSDTPSSNTITTYIVHISGSGWGVARRASSALEAQKGIRKMLISGQRATLIMKDGQALDKEKIAKALSQKGLGLKSFEKTEIQIPAEIYQLAVAGTGWASTNDKVRVALEKVDGISAAYVTNEITLHMASKDAFDLDKIREVLKSFKITIKKSTLILDNPFS